MAMTPEARKNAAWIAVALVVIAIIAVFAFPDNTNVGDSPTTGAPPATMDTPDTPAPVPATPAAPY